MTDRDKIKFAIRYLKKGLKSKRTPPLYEVLMNELGFVSSSRTHQLNAVIDLQIKNAEQEKEIGKLEGKLADLTSEYYELENLKNNEIAELKVYNEKLLDGDIEKHNKIVALEKKVRILEGQSSLHEVILWNDLQLEKENKELNDKLDNLAKVAEVRLANWQKYSELYNKAKDLIKNIIRVTWGEGWNYSLQVKVEAEKFLKECK